MAAKSGAALAPKSATLPQPHASTSAAECAATRWRQPLGSGAERGGHPYDGPPRPADNQRPQFALHGLHACSVLRRARSQRSRLGVFAARLRRGAHLERRRRPRRPRRLFAHFPSARRGCAALGRAVRGQAVLHALPVFARFFERDEEGLQFAEETLRLRRLGRRGRVAVFAEILSRATEQRLIQCVFSASVGRFQCKHAQ